MEDQGFDDAELLASSEAQEEVELVDSALDSGYGTRQETSTLSPSVRSYISSRLVINYVMSSLLICNLKIQFEKTPKEKKCLKGSRKRPNAYSSPSPFLHS